MPIGRAATEDLAEGIAGDYDALRRTKGYNQPCIQRMEEGNAPRPNQQLLECRIVRVLGRGGLQNRLLNLRRIVQVTSKVLEERTGPIAVS